MAGQWSGLRLDLRSGVLVLFTGWATLLSLESWFRLPGVEASPPFPAQLVEGGRIFARVPLGANRKPLPGQLFALAGADYRAPDGARMALRWISHGSSGRGVDFELSKIAPALLGPGARGSCQLPPRLGLGSPELRTNAELSRALGARQPTGGEQGLWLAGLRPQRSNACLWIGRTAAPPTSLTSPPSSSAPRPSPLPTAR
ncbi:hypothetical protein [Cyanobium sp. ATX 6F1]|uniref:hypothetical protein n=1 Tax=unclassified Cyanobium TaxID=2627006 RepID=UPI0020CE1BED|nr:hypothetical protein [Cyanobium sp. ATX 6F1]MCP9915801.1 hypothetical protein [Cyanobium sp. ATX 6F1]